jgi:predicted porin
MNKKLAAVAVAGLFAAPIAALAQSSVTISGQLKGGLENIKIGDYTTGGAGAGARAVGSGSKSQFGIVDDSSRIIFNVREDLGGGLAAIGQVDMRLGLDSGALSAAGNTHVGLQSKSWGRIFFGRQDLHYFNTSGNISGKNSLRADSISLLAYAGAINVTGRPVNGGIGVANATRTTNVLHYTTPNWGGFTGIIAYSSNPFAAEGDVGTTQDIRKGNAWTINPNYSAANWQVGYSYWRAKPDGGMTTLASPGSSAQLAATDQRSHRLYGNYTFGFGLKIGIAWDNSKLEGNQNGGGFAIDNYTYSKRTVWSLPFQYSFMGKHQITGHYTWAKKDTGDAADDLGFGNSTKSKMWAIGYSYDLSKRTSVGITYAIIKNKANAGYQLFTSQSLGLATGGTMAGEDPRIFGTTFRHAF